MDLFTQTIFKVAVALYLLLAGAFVFFREKHNVAARRYVIIICTAAVWVFLQAFNTLLVYAGRDSSLTSSIGGIFALGTSLLIYLFSIQYINSSARVWRIAGYIAAASAAPLVFHPRWIHDRVLSDGQVIAGYGWAYAVYASVAVALAAAGLVVLGVKMRKVEAAGTRNQLKNIFWGLVITVTIVTIFSGILPVLGLPDYFSVGVISVWFLGYYVFNSLLKYGVLDLKGELKVTLRFFFSIVAIYLPTALLLWLGFRLVGESASPYMILYGLLTAIIVTRIKAYFLIPGEMRTLFGPGRDSQFLNFKKEMLASDWDSREFIHRLSTHFSPQPLAILSRESDDAPLVIHALKGKPVPEGLAELVAKGDEEPDEGLPVSADDPKHAAARELGFEYIIKFHGGGALFVGKIGGLRPPTALELSRIKHLLDVYIAQGKIKHLANRLEPARPRVEIERELNERGLDAESSIEELVTGLGRGRAMRKIIAQAARYARMSESILITGETGTGKEFMARYLHALSENRERELMVLDCASIPENLVEAELFGHEKGAFTGAEKQSRGIFERAQDTNLMLDEVGELSMDMQTRLLRVLNERTFTRVGGDKVLKTNARFIFATNRGLEEMIAENKFRQDLFYRINVLHLHLPPLREREEDIPLMAEYFLNAVMKRESLSVRGFTGAALEKIRGHAWPGNARELKHVVHRAAVNARGDLIQPEDLDLNSGPAAHPADMANFLRAEKANIIASGYKEYMGRMEREILTQLAGEYDGNQSLMARKLKLERNFLRRRMREFDLL